VVETVKPLDAKWPIREAAVSNFNRHVRAILSRNLKAGT